MANLSYRLQLMQLEPSSANLLTPLFAPPLCVNWDGHAATECFTNSPSFLPSLTPLGTKSERERERQREREAEILLQGIHLITETELIAS